MTRWPLPVLLAATLAAPVATSATPPAPEVTARTRDRGLFALSSLKGRVVVLDFWAPWCVPCRASFPFLDGLRAKYEAQGLSVVGLTLEENEDAVGAFLDAVPVRFPVVVDATGRSGEAFEVVAMPTTFLIDREGRIAARFEGGAPSVHAKIEAAVAALLAGSFPAGGDVRVPASLEASGKVKAWRRGWLADPIMQLDGDPLTRLIKEHIHASKEAAAGDGGASGGGCGCN
jgi:cytochrome c biogenesis protein CcmG, thiol:disulfide interchange protein DsbE